MNAKKVLTNVQNALIQAKQFKAYAEANKQKDKAIEWAKQIVFLESLLK